MPLLDRGFIFACTTPRKAQGAHSASHKQHRADLDVAVDDYISCAQHLIQQKYTCAAKLVAFVGVASFDKLQSTTWLCLSS